MIDFRYLDKFRIDDFVKDMFIGMCQQIFSLNEGEFKYDPDEEVTKIIVCDHFSYGDINTNLKPTIYTRRRPISFMNTSIDQLLSANLSTGKREYTDLLTGTIELVCVAREGLQAARLASAVFILMQEAKTEFRKLGMHDISVKTLGEEEPKDLGANMRVVEVPVVIQFVFQYTWALDVIGGTILNGIEIAKQQTLTDNSNSDNGNGNSGSNSGVVKTICVPLTS